MSVKHFVRNCSNPELYYPSKTYQVIFVVLTPSLEAVCNSVKLISVLEFQYQLFAFGTEAKLWAQQHSYVAHVSPWEFH